MSVVFAAHEDCFAGWLRAYVEGHALEPAAREALEGLVALIRGDLREDPVVGWSAAGAAAIRASGRNLRLVPPGGDPRAGTAFAGAFPMLSNASSSRSTEWTGAMPIIGTPRPGPGQAPIASPSAEPIIGARAATQQ